MTRTVLTVLVFLTSFAFAQPATPPVDPELERRFRADVAAASGEAALAYDEGNVARAANRADDAIAAYRRAIALAPNVDHVHRRLCGVLVNNRLQLDDALAECERALSLAPSSAYNKSAVAGVLLARSRPGDLNRGVDLAREAAEALPDDVFVVQTWCNATLQIGNMVGLGTCSERLLALDPEGLTANFIAVFVAVQARDYGEAHRRLRKAKAAGLPQEAFDGLSATLDEAEKQDSESILFSDDTLESALLIFLFWALALVVLYVVGLELSRATLRRVDRGAAGVADAAGSSRERRLRSVYKAVLLVTGAFFYLSLPVMLGSIIAAGLIAVLVLDAMGGVPIALLWIIGAVVIATIIAIVRSVFVRRESQPLGVPIDLAKEPKLRALLDEAAAAVGTRPVDTAYLVPGTEIGVTERGSVWKSLRGKPSERILILGVGVFDGMSQLQLRAVLAHEYGHFRNQDTAGGGFALAVRRSLFTLIERLATSGAAGFYNPVWWFVRAFHRMYLGISQGASRLQEVLADRWAVRAYGTEAFVAGYRHIVARNVEFEDDLAATIKEVLENEWPLANLYEHEPHAKKPPEELAVAIEKAMNREPDVYDSHPSPQQRIEAATQLAVAREPGPDDDASVWSLFSDPEQIERAMTAVVRESIRVQHGVIVSDKDYEDDGPSDDDAPEVGDAPTTPVTST